MNTAKFLKLQQLERISDSLDDQVLGLEHQLKSLQRELRRERVQTTQQSQRRIHGSVDFNNFMKLDVLKFPLVEKEELKKLSNEYTRTVDLYARFSNKRFGKKIDYFKTRFDE